MTDESEYITDTAGRIVERMRGEPLVFKPRADDDDHIREIVREEIAAYFKGRAGRTPEILTKAGRHLHDAKRRKVFLGFPTNEPPTES